MWNRAAKFSGLIDEKIHTTQVPYEENSLQNVRKKKD